MQPPATMQELVEQLGRTYSPFERLKILGRGWTLLRQMTPEQRMIVAAQLGLDHADEIVEAITKRSGQQSSPALLSLIEKAQVKGTPHLPQLIADLRDPKQRSERLRQGAQAALNSAEAALDGTPEVPWLPPGAAPPAGEPRRPAPSAARPNPEAPRSRAAPSAARPQPAPAPRPAPVPAAPQAPAVPPAPAAPQVQEPAPPAPAPSPVSPPPAAPPAPKPTPKEASPPVPPAPAAPRPAPIPASDDGVLAGRLAGVPSLTARFLVLRRHRDEAKALSAAALRSVVEGFPDGWARRRALLDLLRSGIPGSLRDALALVEALGSDRDRLWCLGTLADEREVRGADREALLAAANSPTARRRLERRLGGE